jgi:hypothetical protein
VTESGAVAERAGAPRRWGGDVRIVVMAVLPRPWLWWSGLSALARLARRGWWHRAPFLPVPGEAYWHFRLVTALGGSGDSAALTRADVVAYLQWCRRTHPRRG